MPFIFGFFSENSLITFHELSLLPSSTAMTSYEKLFSVITFSIQENNSGNDSSSLNNGMTMEMFNLIYAIYDCKNNVNSVQKKILIFFKY